MPTKTIAQPGTGKTFRLGRNRPTVRCARLSLQNYIRAPLPSAPAAVDYSTKAKVILADILGNDSEGNCTIAGAFHVAGMLIANADTPVPANFNTASAHALYRFLSGGQDTGLDEQTVLNYWQQHGLFPESFWQRVHLAAPVAAPHKIAGWVAIDGKNIDEVKAALWLFENLYFGVELPDAWINPMPSHSGFVWDVAGDPNPQNGHCFIGYGYDADGVAIDTWGMFGKVPWAAVAKYASTAGSGELYAVLGPDAINRATQKAPNGFDLAQLTADLQSLRT